MMFIKKIRGVIEPLCCVFLLSCGMAFAQSDSQSPTPAQQQTSTSDLESQPNTANYPQTSTPYYPRRRHAIPPPNPQPPSDPDPSSSSGANNPSNSATQPDPNSQPPRTVPDSSKSAAATVKRPTKAAPADRASNPPNFAPQNGPMIGPPAPITPTLEQMPPDPAEVTYENGLLSVDSRNARLTDILTGIRAKTGIQFEGLPTGQDRVAGKFGPAPADEVLTSLLQGLHYDYVIIGMPENPSTVQKVILTPTAGASTVAANPGAQHADNANSDDDDSSDESPAEPSESAQPQAAQPTQPRIGNGPKTPEQLLEELRKMQQHAAEQNQQNQQPNQQQSTPPPNPPQNPPSQPPE